MNDSSQLLMSPKDCCNTNVFDVCLVYAHYHQLLYKFPDKTAIHPKQNAATHNKFQMETTVL